MLIESAEIIAWLKEERQRACDIISYEGRSLYTRFELSVEIGVLDKMLARFKTKDSQQSTESNAEVKTND